MPAIDSTNLRSFLPRAIVGGFAGTIVFTLMMKFLAPQMIGHPMDIAAVLGTFTGLGTSAGVVMHFLLDMPLESLLLECMTRADEARHGAGAGLDHA